MSIAFLAVVAQAQEVSSERVFQARPVAGFELLELRGGGQAASGHGSPMVCGELDTPWGLGVDACGTGGGFLYPAQPDVEEMVHLRLEATVPVFQRGRAAGFLQPGVGLAEVERGADQPGFLLGQARSDDQREGAGPEAALSGKVRAWPHERFFVTAEVSVGAGYIPSAPVVLDQGSPWVPFGVGSVGLGF